MTGANNVTASETNTQSIMEKNHHTNNGKHGKIVKYIRTLLLVLTFFCMGLVLTMVYNAIPDIRVRLNLTSEQISRVYSISAVGTLLATILSLFMDRFQGFEDICLGVSLFLSSLVNFFRLYQDQFFVFATSVFLDELLWCTVECVGCRLLMKIWKSQANTFLYIMFFGFPAGAIVGSQLIGQFVLVTVASREQEGHKVHNATEATSMNMSHAMDEPKYSESRVQYAFMIGGAFCLALAICFSILQCFREPTKRKSTEIKNGSASWKDIILPSNWAQGDSKFGMQIFLCYIFSHIFLNGMQRIVKQYISQYAVDSDLGFDHKEASTIFTIFYASDCVASIVSFFISKCVKPSILIFISYHGLLILSICLAFIGIHSKIGLYIVTSIFFCFGGPTWATLNGWADSYITMFSFIIACARFLRAVVDIGIFNLLGYLYTHAGIESIFYVNIGYSVLLCIILYMTQIAIQRGGHTSRHKNDDLTDECPDVELVQFKMTGISEVVGEKSPE